MNEHTITATLAKLATDTDTFAETEYVVSADRGRTEARIGPDRDGLDMVRFLMTEPATSNFAERILADVDMNPNFARRVALALLQAADDADATAAAERAKEAL